MKLLRKIIIFLILRIDWRKLLLIGSVFTIVGVVVQISTLPYPLTIWVFSSSDLPLLYKSMNSNVQLNEKNSLMGLEQFETHLVDPVVSTNTSAVLNHAVSTNTSTVLNHVVFTNTSTVLNHVVSTNTPTVLNHVVSTNTSTVLNHVVSTNTPTVFNHVVSTNTSINFLNQSMSIVEERPISSRKRGQSSKRRRRHRKAEDIVAPPPPLRPVPHRLLRYVRSLTPYEALVYAKKEMENISSVINDPDPELYAPLFRNVSVFQRSYELMELLLKVYIYQDGKRPIFHEPILQGIYSSEGWFMKLMEENRQFVTQDPEKAHLFYLPYSAKQLQTALYVPDSHNIRRLSFFLRDHVNMLAAKYPFWNRTRGSDHFLVACHDWGPYTLTEHEELTKNTIKALCNADASEGIFVAGKDVSLPETTIRNPKRPLRGLGGNRVSQRPILAFFAGHMHGRVRPTLLRYWNDKDEDMRIYRVLPNRVSRNMSYPMHMKSSKYCICPMGYEVNSPRIVESIYHECVPVIIADNFVPPLNEVLDWSSFSVIVEEKDIPKLKDILLSIPLNRYIKMQTNVKMLQQHFHWNARPIRYDMFHMILHSIWHARLNQIQIPQRS